MSTCPKCDKEVSEGQLKHCTWCGVVTGCLNCETFGGKYCSEECKQKAGG
ncbi:hypothetical protein ACFLQ2_03110 [archaeon]